MSPSNTWNAGYGYTPLDGHISIDRQGSYAGVDVEPLTVEPFSQWVRKGMTIPAINSSFRGRCELNKWTSVRRSQRAFGFQEVPETLFPHIASPHSDSTSSRSSKCKALISSAPPMTACSADRAFSVPGEKIFAVQYRQVKIKIVL